MLPMILSISVGSLAAAVLVAMLIGKAASQPGALRLAALDREFAPADDEVKLTDIRRLTCV